MKSKPAKSKPVEDPNISAIARQYNLSRTTLMRWRDQGLDLSDDAAVAAKVASSKAAPSDCEKDTKHRKLSAEADILEHKLAVQRGEYVSAVEMKNEGLRIAAAVKGVFLRMPDDLPPQLAGHTAAEVKKRLKKYALEKLTELSTYRSPVKIEP